MAPLSIVRFPRKPQPKLEDDGNWGCVLCSTRRNWYNNSRDESRVTRADEAQEIMGWLNKKYSGCYTKKISFVPLTRQQAIGLHKSWERIGAMTVGGVGECAEIVADYMQKAQDPSQSQKYLDFAKEVGRQEGFFSNLGDKLNTNLAHWE